MSRFEIINTKDNIEYSYVYGHDHVLGWFFEKHLHLPSGEVEVLCDISEFCNYIPHPETKSKSQRGGKVSKEDIAKAIKWEMETNNFPMDPVLYKDLLSEINKHHDTT